MVNASDGRCPAPGEASKGVLGRAVQAGEDSRADGVNVLWNRSITSLSELIKSLIFVSLGVERAARLDGKDGELPLIFCTRSRGSFHLGSNASGQNTNSLNLNPAEAGWPLGSEQIAAWASSFHFELDRGDDERLQAILLEQDAQISAGETYQGRKLDEGPYLTEGNLEGASFRFISGNQSGYLKLDEGPYLTEGTLEGGSFRFISGNKSGYLKPPRHLEINHGSNRFTAVANVCANANHGRHGQSSDSLSVLHVGAARIKVAVNDDVPPSPGRRDILRRLNDLKSHPLSPRLVPEDAVSHHKGKGAKMAAVRDDFHRKLKPSSPLLKNVESSGKGSSSPTSSFRCKPQENALGELEIVSNVGARRQQSNSLSGLHASPRGSAQLLSQEGPITSTSRLENRDTQPAPGRATHERIVRIRKQRLAAASNFSNSPSPDHALSVPAAIPFKWEEEPGKPKTIAAATHRALARRLSREGLVMGDCMESKQGSQRDDFKPPFDELESENSGKGTEASARITSSDTGTGDPDGRSGSCRYYGRSYLSRHSREGSLGRSSRRYSTQEKDARIDLDGSAAAKFLVEAFESPSSSPALHGASPKNLAVPFQWEATPGRAKVETAAQSPGLLQLPPRLAVPSCRSAGSFARELRASHPFSGFFAPCLTASSPGHRKSAPALVQYTPSKSLPPKVPGSTPSRLKRHGLVGSCTSTPREGCHIRASKSFDDRAAASHSGFEKAPIGHLSTASSPGLIKPRSLFISELKRNNSNAPASPTSILCGPDESGSQTSASNTAFSSGDLEDFARQGSHSRQSASKSSSSASYESIEQEFAELPSPSYSVLNRPAQDPQQCGESQGAPLRKPLRADKPSARLKSSGTVRTPKDSSPALSNYYQCLELTETATSAFAEDVGLLDKRAAPTSSGYLNSDGEPVALELAADSPALQSVAKQEMINRSAQASPKRPTRLPYTMPSAAEQFLASCSASGRRHLVQDLSPRLLHQYSGRRLSASRSGGNTPRVDRLLTSAPGQMSPSPAYAATLGLFSPARQMSPSPAYAATLELFSPAANITAQRRKWPGTPAKTPLTKAPIPKPRRRSRFVLSICKTLKRVLFRQRQHKPIEPAWPRLTYYDHDKSPAYT